jgi:hypothetical protein
MNKPLYKMKYVSGAVGAAVLAASKTYFSSVIDAVKQLVVIDKEVHPERNCWLKNMKPIIKNFYKLCR